MTDASNVDTSSSREIIQRIIWVVTVGWWFSALWLFATLILILSIIGLPLAFQTYKIARYALLPFGKESDFEINERSFDKTNIVWSLVFGWIMALVHFIGENFWSLITSGQPAEIRKLKLAQLCLKPFKFDISPYAITLRKRDLILFYGGAYLIIAYLETILFTSIIGVWSFKEILLNFSLWGIIWIVSLFAYPFFFTDSQSNLLALNPYFSLGGYVIIITMFYLTYRFHKSKVETFKGKKISFNKLIDLYFPVGKTPKEESKETSEAKE